MKKRQAKLAMEIKVSPWAQVYVTCCLWFSRAFNMCPDCDKMSEFISKHFIKYKLISYEVDDNENTTQELRTKRK